MMAADDSQASAGATLWGGRFSKPTAEAVHAFNASLRFDRRLYRYDIEGSIAHVTMLGEQAIIPAAEADAIAESLREILADLDAGTLAFDESCEDIHSFVEQTLIQRIGDIGKKLHTGRSRNDQVALDLRLYCKDVCAQVDSHLRQMLQVLLGLAKAHTETVMPGYTHLQVAQPITFAHHMMAYAEMFVRDRDRLGDAVRRLDVSPLGSGALAANPYPINRERVAELLAMGGITRNSLDGVSDRDYVIELLSVFSLMMVHLSRFSEEIILWNSQGFGFIELDDAYSTGSSMMPQKKNPDVAELARGKAGRVFGHLQAMLTTLKALPLAYNKDMQEDKEALFDAVDTVLQCLPVFTDMLATMTVYPDKMVKAAQSGHINATDAADYLVEHGVPFREAHEIIGQMVRYCAERSMNIDDLSMNELQQFSPKFNVDIYTALDLKTCINRRCVPGGPAPGSVLAHVAELEASLSH